MYNKTDYAYVYTYAQALRVIYVTMRSLRVTFALWFVYCLGVRRTYMYCTAITNIINVLLNYVTSMMEIIPDFSIFPEIRTIGHDDPVYLQ